jgi:hypothetical protein
MPYTYQQIKDSLGKLGQQHDKAEFYVVYSKEHNSILHDPMTNMPVSAIHPNMLTKAAKQYKGIIMTAREAMTAYLKQVPKPDNLMGGRLNIFPEGQ